MDMTFRDELYGIPFGKDHVPDPKIQAWLEREEAKDKAADERKLRQIRNELAHIIDGAFYD